MAWAFALCAARAAVPSATVAIAPQRGGERGGREVLGNLTLVGGRGAACLDGSPPGYVKL